MCQNPDEVTRIDGIDGIVIKNERLASANLFILEIYLIFTYMQYRQFGTTEYFSGFVNR
jgi:hypothetical protein